MVTFTYKGDFSKPLAICLPFILIKEFILFLNESYHNTSISKKKYNILHLTYFKSHIQKSLQLGLETPFSN